MPTSYDNAGRHIREQTIQNGVRYQDNWLAYDAYGRLARNGAYRRPPWAAFKLEAANCNLKLANTCAPS